MDLTEAGATFMEKTLVNRDGTGGTFATTNVVTLTGVHTDLATLLANHQLMVV